MRASPGASRLVIWCAVLILCLGCAQQEKPGLSGDVIEMFTWEITSRGTTSLVYTGTDNINTLKISAFSEMSAAEAEDYISSKMFVINSLYREIRSPYPGALSNRIECAEEFQPVESSGQYLLYATDRFTYGACSHDLIKYRTVIAFRHCESDNTLYQMEFFAPAEQSYPDSDSLLRSVRCE